MMQAMILAAGLGTRLRPWTLHHPKALVPVGGVPMLERVIMRLKDQGFGKIVVNVHHFADQIEAFLSANDFGVEIAVSDERGLLLDTGGAILHAAPLFDSGPVLVHNVDILSNADLSGLVRVHTLSGADSTLLVSGRKSSRKLIFDEGMRLCGWHDLKENVYKPEEFIWKEGCREYAFSGIHVVGERALEEMRRREPEPKFSIIDFLLSSRHKCKVRGYLQEGLELIDIGKPETLERAEGMDKIGGTQ